jgi:2,5-diamino-6-(ribosylamino)-4(3H)-pyrimidinone 5'-phosphate reductase
MRRPRISTNLAISIDGKITSSKGIPSGWTSREDHQRLLDLRRDADALLVGRGTLEADRMTLTSPGSLRQPLRCIVSSKGQLDPQHPIFSKPAGEIHLLVTGNDPSSLPASLAGCVTSHFMSLGAFLEKLAVEMGVQSLHCEGGSQLIRELAAMDAIDNFHLTLAGHTLFGGAMTKTATGSPSCFLPASLSFEITHYEPRGSECFLTYTRRR